MSNEAEIIQNKDPEQRQSEDIMRHAKERPKIYCPSMWKSVHVDVDSYLTPCCMFIAQEDKKTKITDLSDNESIETVLIDEFQEYRDQLTAGIWPKGCNQCEFAEKEGRSSKRLQDMNWNNMRNHDGSLAYITEPTNVKLEYLQLKTGRLCNLECTICTPTCSTSIAATHLKKGLIDRPRYDELQKEIKWASNLDQFKKMNSEYYRIDIAGGEPLMNKTHFKWLDQLPDEQKKKTQLLYNTNGTQTPNEKEIEIWSKFKGVWITFSIDAAYKKFELLRVNAKWDQVYENMKNITDNIVRKQLRHQVEHGYTNTAIVMTIHKGNVNDIFDLYDAIKDIDWVQDDMINYNYLYYPTSMAIHNMSLPAMEKTIANFKANLHRLPEKGKMHQEAIKLMDSIQGFVDGNEDKGSGYHSDEDGRELINMEEITFVKSADV